MDGGLMVNSNNKKSGALYEYKFFAAAMDRGLEVFIPAGDHLPQDCHVVNHSGEVLRVQVKGTSVPIVQGASEKSPRYRLCTSSQRAIKKPIDVSEVDVLAGYIEPLDVFYIIPSKDLKSVTSWLYPHNPKTKSPFEKFRENWGVFMEA